MLHLIKRTSVSMKKENSQSGHQRRATPLRRFLPVLIFLGIFLGYGILNFSGGSITSQQVLAGGGGGGGGGCFISDTDVTLADGTTKAIQDITIGDRVIGQDGSVNTVMDTYQPLLGDRPLYSLNNSDAFVTGGHPFLDTDGNWRAIDIEEAQRDNPTLPVLPLAIGDTIVTTDGTLTITSITATAADPDTQLYNFRTDNTNTFIADGFVVHNKGGGGGSLNFSFNFDASGNLTYGGGAYQSVTPWTSTDNQGNSIIWTKLESGVLCSGGDSLGCMMRIDNPQMTVRYGVTVTNLDTGAQIPHGEAISVPEGTQLQFKFEPHTSTDISWFGTGYHLDTPYGEWLTGATVPSATCATKDLLTQVSGSPPTAVSIFGRLVVAPPVKTMQLLPNLDCTIGGDGLTHTCTAASIGSGIVKFNFAQTVGRFFSSYTINDEYIDYLASIMGAEYAQSTLTQWHDAARLAGLTISSNGCIYQEGGFSPIGATWTTQQSAADNGWRSVTYGNGLFVAVANTDEATGGCFISDTDVTLADGTTKAIQDITIGDRVIGQDGSINTVTDTYQPLLGDRPLYSINNTEAFVTGGHPFLDTDGHWRAIDTEEAKRDNPTLTVLPLTVGDTIVTTDGTLTVTSITATAADPETQLYNFRTDNTNTFIADGFVVHNISGDLGLPVYGGNRVMTSPDGITWTLRTSAALNEWMSVTYGNGLFVAVARTGTGNRVMTSPDGITWTARASAADNDWWSVTYGNGLFVAVSTTGSGNRVMTSPDGITWTARASAANNGWRSVTYGNGLFVAVARTGTGNRVMTSPNGINWTARASAADNEWMSVTYSNGLFVAVASSGTGNRVMTSPDGITWTARTSAADNDWRSVTYGSGYFVATASSGSGNRVMTSPNGVTWTLRSSAANNTWFGVTHHDGKFVAVSGNGTGNRVMTSEQLSDGTIEGMHSVTTLPEFSYNPTEPQYQLTVPAIVREYTVEIVAAEGDEPEVPSLTFSTSGGGSSEPMCSVGEPFTLGMQSEDPQGDDIRYLIDWGANGSVNAHAPASGYVPSGTTQETSRTFTQEGSQSVRVRTEDDQSNVSEWSETLTFDCIDNRPPNAPIVITATGTQCIPDEPQDITVSATHPAGKNVFYQLDMNRDGVVDELIPISGTVPAGTSQTTSYAFPHGNYAFDARAVDSDSNASSWTTVAGICGRSQEDCPICEMGIPDISLGAQPLIVSEGQTTRLSWSLAGLNSIESCSIAGTNGEVIPWNTIAATANHITQPITQQTTYTLNCSFTDAGVLSDTAVIFLTPVWQEF